MTKPNKSAAFLQALGATASPAPEPRPAADEGSPSSADKTSAPSKRAGLKHIGGYFGRADVEKFAILRARLGLDNSELIKLAIEELYAKQEAKRHFGDT